MPIETAVICRYFVLVSLPSVISVYHPHNRAVFKRIDTPHGVEYIEIENKPIGNIEFEKYSFPDYSEVNERTDIKLNERGNSERRSDEGCK